MKKRVHVFYDGQVQGVGFRFTAEYIAQDLNLRGWVCNLPGGRVELVAEGEESQLNNMLTSIKEKMRSYINEESIEWESYRDEFKDFGIRFYR